MYLEATFRLNFKEQQRRPEQRSFMFTLSSDFPSLIDLKKNILEDYGLHSWVMSHGVANYSFGVAIKRLARDEEYPNGRFLMSETEKEWQNTRHFLTNVPKTHSLYFIITEVSKYKLGTLSCEVKAKQSSSSINIDCETSTPSGSSPDIKKDSQDRKRRGRSSDSVRLEIIAKKLREGNEVDRTTADESKLEKFKKDIADIHPKMEVINEIMVRCPCSMKLKLPIEKAARASYIRTCRHVKTCFHHIKRDPNTVKGQQLSILDAFQRCPQQKILTEASPRKNSTETLSDLEPIEPTDDIQLEPDCLELEPSACVPLEETDYVMDFEPVTVDEIGESSMVDDDEDVVMEIPEDPDDEINPDERRSEYFEDLDPAVVHLQRMLTCGKLTRDHIFYKLMSNALFFASCDGNQTSDSGFSWDDDVISFCNTLEFHGGQKIMNILRGHGQHGVGVKGSKTFSWSSYNIPLPSEKRRKKHINGYSTKSGILKPLMSSCLKFSHNNKDVSPLIETENEVIYPVSLAMDGMAITPGLVFDERQGKLLGTSLEIDKDFIAAHPKPDYEDMKNKFITEVESIIVTTLDGQVTLPVGMNYTTKGTSGCDMASKVKCLKQYLETCENCLNSCTVEQNVITGSICSESTERDENMLLQPLTGCQNCKDKGIQCVRLQVIVFATDCEEKNKKAMEILEERGENLLPIPEAVHTTKRLKGSFGNWWLICEDTRINLSMLRTARMQNNELRKLVPLDAVRQKDRMDVQSCLQISQPNVRALLAQMDSLSQVIVPEKYRLWENNKPGTLSQPIAISPMDTSQHIVLDAAGKLFILKLHYPAELIMVDSSLVLPLGVTSLKNGLVLVSEPTLRKLSAIDISGDNVMCVEEMTVPQLKAALQKYGYLTRNLRNSRKIELKTALFDVIEQENLKIAKPVLVGKKSYRKYLVRMQSSGIIPGVLFADRTNENVVLVTDTATQDIYSVELQCSGVDIYGKTLSHYDSKGVACISSLCCDEACIYAIVTGPNGGLMAIDRQSCAQNFLISNGKTDYDLLSCAMHGDIIALGDQGSGSIHLWNKTSSALSLGCGSGVKEANDGLKTSFIQPAAMCFNYKKSLLVCDAAVGQVKMVSLSTTGLVKYLEAMYLLNVTFGVHLARQQKPLFSFDQAIANLEKVIETLTGIVENFRSETGSTREVTQGPEGTPASKTIKSVQMILNGICRLNEFLQNVQPAYTCDLSSVLTLVCEHLFSVLRSKNPMPDVLEVSQLFSHVVFENMKKLTHCGFLYFTNRRVYYDVPEGHLAVKLVEYIEVPKSGMLSVAEKKVMRQWRIEHGQKVKQNTIRNSFTKDKPGTLPLNFYVNFKTLNPNPVDMTKLAVTQTQQNETEPDHNHHVETEHITNNAPPGSDGLVFYAVRHPPSSFVLIGTEEEVKEGKSCEGQMYENTSNALLFSLKSQTSFTSIDVLTRLQDEDYEQNGDNVELQEQVFDSLLKKSSDQGERLIGDEFTLQDEEDDCDDGYMEVIPVQRSRSRRTVKFNRKFEDFWA